MIAQWIIEYNEKYNHTLGYRRMCNYINRKHDKHYNKKRIHRCSRKYLKKRLFRHCTEPEMDNRCN